MCIIYIYICIHIESIHILSTKDTSPEAVGLRQQLVTAELEAQRMRQEPPRSRMYRYYLSILYYIILSYCVLYYIILLYYVLLCYIILYYIILYYIIYHIILHCIPHTLYTWRSCSKCPYWRLRTASHLDTIGDPTKCASTNAYGWLPGCIKSCAGEYLKSLLSKNKRSLHEPDGVSRKTYVPRYQDAHVKCSHLSDRAGAGLGACGRAAIKACRPVIRGGAHPTLACWAREAGTDPTWGETSHLWISAIGCSGETRTDSRR